MPRTQINCPQCRQPIVADVQQLFDVNEDPRIKQMFLSGSFNIAECPHCSFQGMVTMPLVYHDPEKELLLTYFPVEMGLPLDEQQKMIGPLINRVVNGLPQEKRKGYLLNPKTMLTLQLMLETVLEADGITKEMIKAQEERINLIQRLMTASEDARVEIIEQEDKMIDGDFFGILSRLVEAALGSQDETSAQQLNLLQQNLLIHSTQGRKLKAEADEVQAVMKELQDLGENITREKLLDIVVQSTSDTRLRALVRMARPGMDYTFFQMLSERIERARSKGRDRLVETRAKLLTFTQEVDDELATRTEMARKNVEAVLQTDDIKATLEQNMQAVDEFFIQAVTESLTEARKAGNLEHSGRLQQILDIIEELSAPPAEFNVIEDFLEIAEDEAALKIAVESRSDEITPELLQMVNVLVTRTQESIEQATGDAKEQQRDVLTRLQAVYNAVLALSMRRSFKTG